MSRGGRPSLPAGARCAFLRSAMRITLEKGASCWGRLWASIEP